MKENFYLQFKDQEFILRTLTGKAKEVWKAEGKAVKNINKLDLYIKPEEKMCYFVINDAFNRRLEMETD